MEWVAQLSSLTSAEIDLTRVAAEAQLELSEWETATPRGFDIGYVVTRYESGHSANCHSFASRRT
jgi:hypothetical protein